jgi:hypothetical protein
MIFNPRGMIFNPRGLFDARRGLIDALRGLIDALRDMRPAPIGSVHVPGFQDCASLRSAESGHL